MTDTRPTAATAAPTDTELEELFHQHASLVFSQAHINLQDFLVASRLVLQRWGHD